ncbi:MAG TPA: hypothetical protein VGB37_06450 [Candidatus Lokiarchaeia archaeon]
MQSSTEKKDNMNKLKKEKTLSISEKEILKDLLGSRANNKNYSIGKAITNGEIFYYCINKKALKNWIVYE